MFKRKMTFDKIQKVKMDLQSEYLFQLHKCQHIPNDDKLKIRNLIKQNISQINDIFQTLKKQRNYSQFQIRLRRYLQSLKQQQKRNSIQSQKEKKKNDNKKTISQNQCQDRNGEACDHENQKLKRKIIIVDINQLRKNGHQNVKYSPNLTPTNQRLNRTDKINTSPNYSFGQSKQNSKQNKDPNQTNQISLLKSKSTRRFSKGQIDTTRSTFRLKQHRLSSQQSPNCNEIIINKYNQQPGLAYPSNIKHLLSSKLKSQKIIQKRVIQKGQTPKMIYEITIEKKSAKLKCPDQSNSTLNLCQQSISRFPLTMQQTFNGKNIPNTHNGQMSKKIINQYNLDQKVINQFEEEEIHGKFYMKIKNIIEDHNF